MEDTFTVGQLDRVVDTGLISFCFLLHCSSCGCNEEFYRKWQQDGSVVILLFCEGGGWYVVAMMMLKKCVLEHVNIPIGGVSAYAYTDTTLPL